MTSVGGSSGILAPASPGSPPLPAVEAAVVARDLAAGYGTETVWAGATFEIAAGEMVGVLGRVCVSIRAGGTGKLIYSQVGTRRVCDTRADDGSTIAKGTEVVVTRYEKGIAYVRLWSDIANEELDPAKQNTTAMRP